MVGSGEPPMLLQVSSIGLSSVATAMEPGEITGGCGGVRTVTLWNSWCTSAPVPWALMRHSKRPLSRLYETFFICRSYMPRSGWKSSLQRKTNDEIYDVIFLYFYRLFCTQILNVNHDFLLFFLSLSIFHLFYLIFRMPRMAPPPCPAHFPSVPHITNCANIGFSVGYPVAAAGASVQLSKDPQVVPTLNVSRNINKY